MALRVALGPSNGAAAGHFYRSLEFANISGRSCTLFGYPGLSFVTAIGGTRIGAGARRGQSGERVIVLAPGATAHVRVDLLDVLAFPPARCAARTAHWLKVYPPGQSSARYVRWKATVCSAPKIVYLYVDPVRQGA